MTITADLPALTAPVLSPVTDAQLPTAMLQRIAASRAASSSEALREMRTAFPDVPLAVRVAALAMFRRPG
jgi:hypothetical protein